MESDYNVQVTFTRRVKQRLDSATESLRNKCVVLSLLCGLFASTLYADDFDKIEYPPLPDEKLFTALKQTSPFLRTLNISETYVLRAVATYEELAYARVYNKETKQTVTIEIGGEPKSGLNLIKIVEPGSTGDLSRVAAQISFAGEVAELKYSPEQLTPTSRGGSGRGGPRGRSGGGDDRRKGPSSKEREKYMQLSEPNKEKLKAYIKATVTKYPDMPREERGNLIRGALQKLADGRDLDVPK